MSTGRRNEAIEAEIEALGDLSLGELRRRWRDHHGRAAPQSLRRKLLIRALAYQMQVNAHGGLSPAAARRLQAIAAGRNTNDVPRRAAVPEPGTRFIRDWNGATHIVDVVEGGYLWKGARYRSLSVIARTITGARWSGPRFFGLGSAS